MSCPHGFPTLLACYDCMTDEGVGAEPVPPEEIVVQFEAKFDSNCDECGRLIRTGEPTAKTNRVRYIHPQCLRRQP